MSVTLTPPYEEWSAILTANRSVVRALHGVLGEEFVASARRELVEVAAAYRSETRACALLLGISMPDVERSSGQYEVPIVMAGHQPVVYHPGILEKTRRLAMFAAHTGAYALNIAIDTDEGDGGRLLWPLREGDDVIIKQGGISTGGAIYRDQVVASTEESAAIFGVMKRDLETSGCSAAIAGAERAAALYGVLQGKSIVLANTIVRQHMCGMGYDEVPLSRVLEAPSIRECIERIVRDAERFAELYNATLESYRIEHKIRNPANPFPNMTLSVEEIELPLWELSGSSRKQVVVARRGPSPIANILAPRGSVVTLILRGVCSDLFIHGLGGGKYDRFVNAFAEAYWGSPLPNFVVASATQYLFPERVERYLHARDVRAKYKELVSHTSSFIGTGMFSSEDELVLRPLLEQRSKLVPRLQACKSKQERSSVAHELNELNRCVKSAIDGSSLAPMLAEGAIDDARLSRWSCREYPFFLF
jgi:hypothetical protein